MILKYGEQIVNMNLIVRASYNGPILRLVPLMGEDVYIELSSESRAKAAFENITKTLGKESSIKDLDNL